MNICINCNNNTSDELVCTPCETEALEIMYTIA